MRADHLFSPPRRPVPLSAEAGFTLVEVLASAMIVILIAVAVAQGLMSGAHLSSYQQHKSQADEVAQREQERLRGLSSKQLSALTTPSVLYVTLSGTTYTVTSSASLLSSSNGNSCTTAGGTAVAYYRTHTTVSWTATNGTQSIDEDSLITPPISGALLTQVTDETGANLSGASVTATGQTSGAHDQEGGTTDASGCVIMTGLTPDTYSVSVTDPGYVDYNGNTTLSDSATVTASGTARPTTSPEVIGRAGSVQASFTTPAYTSDTSLTVNSATPGQYATNLSYYGAGGSVTMSSYKTAASTAGWANAFTASNLFPFYFSGPPGNYTGNYHMWGGACLQEEPPTAYDSTTVQPGVGSTITVQEPSLILTAYFNNGTSTTRIAPADAKVYFVSSSGTACSDTWTEPIRATAATSNNGVLAYPAIPYAANTTSGSTASASNQTGTLSACVDYYTGNTYGYRRATGTISLPLSMTSLNTLSLTVSRTGTSGTCP